MSRDQVTIADPAWLIEQGRLKIAQENERNIRMAQEQVRKTTQEYEDYCTRQELAKKSHVELLQEQIVEADNLMDTKFCPICKHRCQRDCVFRVDATIEHGDLVSPKCSITLMNK